MLKNFISKLRLDLHERQLKKISKTSLSFDIAVSPIVTSILDLGGNDEKLELIFKNISPGSYKLLLSTTQEANFFEQKKLYASFDIADVIKIENKQKRLGLNSYSKDKGIFSFFKGFHKDGNSYGQINLDISRFIKYLHVVIRCNNSSDLICLDTLSFQECQTKQAFVNKEKVFESQKKEKINWQRYDLVVDSICSIFVSSNYKNIKEENRKAILLFKAYDHSGQEIKNNVLGNVAFSRQFETLFKYIPDTKNKSLEIHSFVVPKDVAFIELAQIEFNIQGNEKVLLDDIRVVANEKAGAKIIELKNIECYPDSEVQKFTKNVLEGKKVNINVNVDYENIEQKNKKALLLVSFFDQDGNLVENQSQRLLWIEKFSSYYKYLPDTNGLDLKVHECQVPEGASSVTLGLVGFGLQEGESIKINSLSLEYEIQKNRLEAKLLTNFTPPSALKSELSIIGWEEEIDSSKPTIMGIMDEFTQGCFAEDLNLIQPRTDNWYVLSEKYKPELIFIESAWRGNSGNWQYRVGKYSNKPGNEIAEVTQYAKAQRIPTMFWNKEDPVHHEKFMDTAKLVDYIFTTDANKIDSYKSKTGNKNVFALPFAAQPALHKPAPLANRIAKSCFAGSWYGNRHAERGEAMYWLLKIANKYGLDIFDRNYGSGNFPFPDEFSDSIKGSLPYKELCAEYARYRVFLNVNSVTNSPTMFSRRVFELLASGTPVVSTYAKGIEELFSKDIVWLVNSEAEANEAIHTLMTDDVEWRRRSLAGIREVFTKHTYAHRLNEIFTIVGSETRLETEPTVVLIAKANSTNELNMINQFSSEQQYKQHKLIVEVPEGLVNTQNQQNCIEVVTKEELTQRLYQVEKDTLLGQIDLKENYGSHYLTDLVAATLYEPEALVWSITDRSDKAFCYTSNVDINGSIWRASEFMDFLTVSEVRSVINHQQCFCIDSDQFQRNY